MSAVECLREFIRDRFTVVAEEIFAEVKKTIVQYEEEINHQLRLLEISRTAEIKSHIIDLPHQEECKEEEGLDDKQVCNQERSSSLDQEDSEPPETKEEPEEQEELCTSREGEKLELKQEAEGNIVWTEEEQCRLSDVTWKPEIHLHRIDLPDQHISKEDILGDQQFCNQETNSSVGQEDPELPEIKEEKEKLCSSRESGEQLVVKQEAETFMLTPTYEERDHSEPEANSDQLISFNSTVSENKCQTDTSKKSVKCDTCGKTSVKCDTCGKTFHDKSRLAKHLLSHTGERPHSCSTCGKRFSQIINLKTHMRIHTGEKPYSCSTCGNAFSQKSTLAHHIRIHTGEKLHSCSTCGKRFTWKSELKRHVRIHTGEKPYSCSTCGKTFSRKSTLKTHSRVHTGEKPYSCNTCGKEFTVSSTLKTHIRIHTGEKIHSCSICGKRFIQIIHLKRHMKIHTV